MTAVATTQANRIDLEMLRDKATRLGTRSVLATLGQRATNGPQSARQLSGATTALIQVRRNGTEPESGAEHPAARATRRLAAKRIVGPTDEQWEDMELCKM